MAARIWVEAPGGGYDILIERGLSSNLGERVEAFGLAGRVVVATSEPLAPLYGERLARQLPNACLVTMPDGEPHKNLETVARLYSDFVNAGLDRNGTVIALGGGVVGDTVGFAAATYMRGVRLVQMPTTLLAMVDSSVGGKVGVDLPQGKNLVGAFKQPALVLIDPDVLSTLPEREWRCGMGEVIKHGLLADASLLDPALQRREHAEELVQRAVQVKVDVVQTDPFEQGVRAHLNLGHTFGHAIEQASGYGWQHGEAVGFGLLAAVRLSTAMNLCNAGLEGTVETALKRVGLPCRLGGLGPEAIVEAMGTDKKRKDGQLRLVLLRRVGQPEMVTGVPKETVIGVLESLR